MLQDLIHDTEDGTQGVLRARQTFYQLSYTPRLRGVVTLTTELQKGKMSVSRLLF